MSVLDACIDTETIAQMPFLEYQQYLHKFSILDISYPLFPIGRKMRSDDEKCQIGREIKLFLAVNRIARETFADRTGLGKSTVDKLITGIFSEATLAKVLERTGFRLRTLYALKKLGGYSRSNWEGYISDYLMLVPAFDGSDAIEASLAHVGWDDMLPGLVLKRGQSRDRAAEPVGALWIPHERSPLVYIQPTEEIGVRMVVTTMIGEPVMRGLILAVDNCMANAWIPVAAPVSLTRTDRPDAVPVDALGRIEPGHAQFSGYAQELRTTLARQYGRLVSRQAPAVS